MTTTTSISIASNALLLLGHNQITSFEDAGAGGTVASAFYETSYVALLTLHPWTFAKKKKTLSKLTAKPLNNFQYQYQIPTDCLRVITVFPTTDYEIFEDKLYTDASSVDLDYIYRVPESFLPPLYRETLEFYLAAKWAIPVTENATNASVYESKFEVLLKKAKFNDSAAATSKSVRSVGTNPLRIRQARNYRSY